MNGWMDGWMGMGGWVDGWMDGLYHEIPYIEPQCREFRPRQLTFKNLYSMDRKTQTNIYP